MGRIFFCIFFGNWKYIFNLANVKQRTMENPLKIFKTNRGACNYAAKLEMQNPSEDIGINRYEVYCWGDNWAVIDEEK